jgi:tetratricopeptide (TPR) repeat protein
MLTPQSNVTVNGAFNLDKPDAKRSSDVLWGLGWGLEKTADGTAFWHWGDNGDTKAFVLAYPQRKTGLVMFANSANGLSLLNELVRSAMGNDQPALAWLNLEQYNSYPRLLLKTIVKSDAETALADYRQRRDAKTVVSLTENQMNTLGYQLLRLKRVKDAIAVFRQNTVDFPQAYNTWDSLAEGYMIDGDKESAIKYYKKSLELNPENTNAVEKLKELQSSPASNVQSPT